MKLTLFLLPLSLFGAITKIGPDTCNQNSTCNYSAIGGTAPYTFTLVGSSSGAISTSGVYTAPSKVTPQNQTYGCQIGANNDIINTRIDNAPIDTRANIAGGNNNTVWQTALTNNTIGIIPSMYINRTSISTDPTYHFDTFYTPTQNGDYVFPPPYLRMGENGTNLWADNGTDVHYINIIKDTCNIVEAYQYFPINLHVSPNQNNTSEAAQQFVSAGFLRFQGGDQAGGAILPLIYTVQDFLNAANGNPINHAVRVTFNGINCNYSQWPANQGGTKGPPWPVIPTCGTRLRLKAAYTIGGSFDSSCSTTACHNIFNAIVTQMKNYGFIIMDTGGNAQVQAELGGMNSTDIFGATGNIQSRGGVALGTWTNWEFVDTSGCETNQDGSGINDFWMEVAYNCSWATPINYVRILITDNVGATATFPIALVGVTLGCDYYTKTWIAGTAPTQVNCWVNGSTNTGITYSLSPSGGSNGTITTGGVYSPPSSVISKIKTVITATSNADGTVVATQNVIILPNTNPIRINLGAVTDYTDGNSLFWFADQKTGDPAMFSTGYNTTNNFIGLPWTNTNNAPDLYNYQVSGSFAAGDYLYNIQIPNGSWTVTLYMATVFSSANQQIVSVDAGTTIDAVPSFDTFLSAGSQYNAFTKTFTTTVNNSQLQFILRWRSSGTAVSNPCCQVPLFPPGPSPSIAAMTLTPNLIPSVSLLRVGSVNTVGVH